MSTGRILVIAPNPDLRRSLAFALESEGHVITSTPDLRVSARFEDFDAVVLDHKAIRQASLDCAAHARYSATPVILLASGPQEWLLAKVFRTVPTPIMGDVLNEAVAEALAAASVA